MLGNLTKRPCWLYAEYLRAPKVMLLEAWPVEAIFGEWVRKGRPTLSSPSPPPAPSWLRPKASLCGGPGPRPVPLCRLCSQVSLLAACLLPAQAGKESTSQCVSQTVLHVRRWGPEGEAEILILAWPYYQKDVSSVIMSLADYHRQVRDPGQ